MASRSEPVAPDEHELAFARAFIRREKRERYVAFLSGSPAQRKKILDRLHHMLDLDLDPRFLEALPSNTHDIESLLRRLGAGATCRVISYNEAIDGREMPLNAALDEVVGFQLGSILLCVPGKLAYYEDEEGNRYVCRRA